VRRRRGWEGGGKCWEDKEREGRGKEKDCAIDKEESVCELAVVRGGSRVGRDSSWWPMQAAKKGE